MGQNIDTIMESEEVQTFFEQNQEVLQEAEEIIQEFPKILKSFVLENTQEFIGETLEETKKNIRVFSEVATAQYIQEVSAITSNSVKTQESIQESALSDYL